MRNYRTYIRELTVLAEQFCDDVRIEVTGRSHLKVILTAPNGRSRFVICSKTPGRPGLNDTRKLFRAAAQELGLIQPEENRYA